MDFSQWLNNELEKRGMTQGELARQTRKSGHKISRTQITYILNGSRQAGPDACIAIAHGLSLPREEIFRARGWLLKEPQEIIPPKTSPKTAQVIRLLTLMPLDAQEKASEGLLPALKSMASFAGLEDILAY